MPELHLILRLDGPVHLHFDNPLVIQTTAPHDALAQINQKLKQIIMTQEEATQALTDVGAELTKVQAETATLVQNVADLTKALADAQASGGAVTPALEAAVNKVAAQTKTVDDLVPDAPATT